MTALKISIIALLLSSLSQLFVAVQLYSSYPASSLVLVYPHPRHGERGGEERGKGRKGFRG